MIDPSQAKPRLPPATIALAIAWMTLPALFGVTLVANIGTAREWLLGQEHLGIFIFVAVFALTTGCGVLPPYAQAILAGWAFGAVEGTAAVTVGLICGAAIGWTLAKVAAGPNVISWIDRNPKGRVIRHALVESNRRRTFSLILLLRLPPNSPFAIANLAMGASGVRLWPLLAATGIGMLPRTIVLCTAAGAAAATGATDIQSFVHTQGWIWLSVGVACLLVAFAIIATIAKRALASAGLNGM